MYKIALFITHFLIVIVVLSCKKTEPEIFGTTEADNPYFSFLKDKRVFTYKEYQIFVDYLRFKVDTTSVKAFTVEVSKTIPFGNHFALSNSFPLIDSREFYRTNSMFGVSPNDSILSKHYEIWNSYVVGFSGHSSLPKYINSAVLKNQFYKGDSVEVYYLRFSNDTYPHQFGHISISKDLGILSANFGSKKLMPQATSYTAYELVSTNF